MKSYFWRIFIALTQLLNAVLGGWPDESTSSRLWRLEQLGLAAGMPDSGAAFLRKLVDRLFWWQRGHCGLAYESERKRYQFPPILR